MGSCEQPHPITVEHREITPSGVMVILSGGSHQDGIRYQVAREVKEGEYIVWPIDIRSVKEGTDYIKQMDHYNQVVDETGYLIMTIKS